VNPTRVVLEAAAFRALSGAAGVLPRPALLSLGTLAGRLGWFLDRRHRRIALDNLRRAMSDQLDEAEIRRVALRCWEHFGRITLDALAFRRLAKEGPRGRVSHEGIDNLRAAYAEGRGVLEFSGHYGHWELAALVQSQLGFPLALVARPLDNPRLEALLRELRQATGNVIIYKRRAVRDILAALRGGLGVAILIDQDARDAGVFVPFFGRPASTTPTPALLATRTGVPVLPVHCTPEGDDGYRVVYGEPVRLAPTGDVEADVLALTARYTAILEGWIRSHPEYWLWMHRRWKTRPPGDAGAVR
jgi:KDO2-lipid IV(A) lauroyltransferase